jgi:hypothetical protein
MNVGVAFSETSIIFNTEWKNGLSLLAVLWNPNLATPTDNTHPANTHP